MEIEVVRLAALPENKNGNVIQQAKRRQTRHPLLNHIPIFSKPPVAINLKKVIVIFQLVSIYQAPADFARDLIRKFLILCKLRICPKIQTCRRLR
jgi:hypothetical protein